MFECCDVLVGDVDEYGLVERDAIGYRLDIFSGNQLFPVCIDRLDTEKAVAVIKQFHKSTVTAIAFGSQCIFRQI